jgi:hypothetical protein
MYPKFMFNCAGFLVVEFWILNEAEMLHDYVQEGPELQLALQSCRVESTAFHILHHMLGKLFRKN